MRRLLSILSAGALLFLGMSSGSAVAHDVEGSGSAGGAAAEKLVNFEHVFNYDTDAGTRAEGTDLAFWTNEAPLRDYATGEYVDENGDPLLPDEFGNPPEPILAERDFVVVGVYDLGARIFDITDPEQPRLVSEVPCAQLRNDPAVKQFTDADGETIWLLALAKDDDGEPICLRRPRFGENHGAGITVYDVTDPYEWSSMYSVQFAGGAHNFLFHPTKPFGWASTGDLPGAAPPPLAAGDAGFNVVPIIDFSDPHNPVISEIDVPGGGPHDLEFSQDGTRAYVAAENNYQIYATTDPANPTLLGQTPNIGSYAHGAFPTPDKKIMITNNESLVLGAFLVNEDDVQGQRVAPGSCPGEGLGFYDVDGDANEANPVFKGYYVPQEVIPNAGYCTSHFGNVADNNHIMSIGWYVLGARIVDFANPSAPEEIGVAQMKGSNVWSAKFYKGPYLYTGDFERGFDVFKWTGDGPAPWEVP